MPDAPRFSPLGLHPAACLAPLRALSATPGPGANVVPFLPRRARSCRSGLASGERAVISLFPQGSEVAVPERVSKDM